MDRDHTSIGTTPGTSVLRFCEHLVVLRREWGRPAPAYVHVKNVKPGEVMTLVYPLVTRKQMIGIWPTGPGGKLTIWWKGNSVVNMEPKGKGLPADFSNLAPVPP